VNVTLDLNPEVEKGLMARAEARGVSLEEYLREEFDNLSDLLLHSPFAGANLTWRG
jgi:hypothetical protein